MLVIAAHFFTDIGATVASTDWRRSGGSVSLPAPVGAHEPGARAPRRWGLSRIARAAASTIRFGPMAATMMACPPPRDRVERAYVAALAAARSYRVEGDAFTLFDARRRPVVAMSRVP